MRTKTIFDSLHTDKQTQDIPLLTQTMLALPPTDDCTICHGACTCTWSNDLNPKEVDYNIVQLNEIEMKQFEACISDDKVHYLQKVSDLYSNLLTLTDETRENSNLEESMPSMKDAKSKWKLHKNEDVRVERLTLPCVEGTDTD